MGWLSGIKDNALAFVDPGYLWHGKSGKIDWDPSEYAHDVDPLVAQMGKGGRDYYNTLGAQYLNQMGEMGGTAPQIQYTAPSQDPAAAQQQMALMEQLQGQAAGTSGPSAAATQMQQGREADMAALLSASRSGRGTNLAAGQRVGLSEMAKQQQATTGMLATLRAQEQQQAQQLLGSMAGQARGQSWDEAYGTSELGLAGEQAKAEAELQWQQLSNQWQSMKNDVMTKFMEAGYSQDEAEMKARMELEGWMVDQGMWAGEAVLNAKTNEMAAQQNKQGAVVGAAGSMIGSYIGRPRRASGGSGGGDAQ